MSEGSFFSLYKAYQKLANQAKRQMYGRGVRASNELRNAALLTLRGRRSGRRYLVPGTKRHYRASAPGERPAVRTGTFRNSWVTITGQEAPGVVRSSIVNSTRVPNGGLLGEYLEHGTGKMAARPYQEEIRRKALPKIRRIYQEPYHL